MLGRKVVIMKSWVKKYFVAGLLALSLLTNPVSIKAEEVDYIIIDADVSGEEFFDKVSNLDNDTYVFVSVKEGTEKEKKSQLRALSKRVKAASSKGIDYIPNIQDNPDSLYKIGTSAVINATENDDIVKVDKKKKVVYISTYMSGEAFLKTLKQYVGYQLYVYIIGDSEKEQLDSLNDFENRVNKVSNHKYSFLNNYVNAKIVGGYLVFGRITKSNGVSINSPYIDIKYLSGKDFIKQAKKQKEMVLILVEGSSDKEISKKLKAFSKKVKKVSASGEDYGIEECITNGYTYYREKYYRVYQINSPSIIIEKESGTYGYVVNKNNRYVQVSTSMSGEQFLSKVSKEKGYDISIHLIGNNQKEKLSNLKAFEARIKKASKKSYHYDLVKLFNQNGVSDTMWYYQITTDDIAQIESSNIVMDISKTSGSTFINTIHNSKTDTKVCLTVKASSSKEADEKLKKFADNVKKASKYNLVYGIYTAETRKSLKDLDKGAKQVTVVLKDGTKDLKAVEELVSKIVGWNKMSDNNKFLALSGVCNKRSDYELPGNKFHFYNTNNKLVCRYYADMYQRIVEIITTDCEAEFFNNSEVHHALVILRVGSHYYEGNNYILDKNVRFKESNYDFRSWYKLNPKKYGTKLGKAFIKANRK